MGDMSAEPSMEDILSSIKRIIAEEGETATAASRARRATRIMNPQAQPGGFGHDEILELSDPVRVSDEEAPVAIDRPAAIEPASESPTPFSRPANAPVELLLRRRVATPAEKATPSLSPVEPVQSAPAVEPAQSAPAAEAAQSASAVEPAQSASAVEPAQSASVVKPERSASAADPAPSPPVTDPILSSRAADASRGSLDALSRLIVKPDVAGSDTLEGLVREMLRPMLREWLDSHLPAMVETMVSREIARITGSR